MKKSIKIITIITAVATMIISVMHFLSLGVNIPHSIYGAIGNTIKIFTIDPKVSPEELNLGAWLSACYTVVCFIAPIATIFAIYKIIEKQIKKQALVIKTARKENILVYGFNDKTSELIKNAGIDQILHVIADENDNINEEAFKDESVLFYYRDLSANVFSKTKESLGVNLLKKIDKIIVNEIPNYSQVIKDMSNNTNAKICFLEERSNTYQLIHDENVEIVNLSALKISKVIEKYPVFSSVNKENNINILVSGESSLATEAIMQSINQGVASSSSVINISVVSENAENVEHRLTNMINVDCELSDINSFSNGKLNFNFINRKQITKKLLKELKPTYAFLIKDNPLDNFEDMICINEFASEDITVIANVNQSDVLDNVISLSNNKDWLSVNNIFDENFEKKQKMTNVYYNLMYNILTENNHDSELTKNNVMEMANKYWKELDHTNKQSNRFSASHISAKEYFLRVYFQDMSLSKDKISEIINEKISKPLGLNKITDIESILNVNANLSTATETLLQDKLLQELMMIEHRRWNYFTFFKGWSYTTGKKDKKNKFTPYLCKFEELLVTYPDVAFYDLIPYLLMVIKEE